MTEQVRQRWRWLSLHNRLARIEGLAWIGQLLRIELEFRIEPQDPHFARQKAEVRRSLLAGIDCIDVDPVQPQEDRVPLNADVRIIGAELSIGPEREGMIARLD